MPRQPKHGAAKRGSKRNKEYTAWQHMKSRCLNPNTKNYSNYGGRGIKVCDRWLKFENFYLDIGDAPSPKHSLDRYPDVNGNYEPSNCRWATDKEQQRNRRDNLIIKLGNVEKPMCEWAEIFNIPVPTIKSRIIDGNWSIEEALTTPKVYKQLSKEQADLIREMHSSGLMQTDIAKHFDTTPTTINKIIKHKTHAKRA